MRRWFLLIAAFAIVAAACGDGGDAVSSAPDSSESPITTSPVTTTPVTTTPVTTSPATTSPEAETPATTSPSVEGPAAPDFTLALGDGGEFTLSEESKPVYMVFWAEW